MCEETFARQKKLGVISPDCKLTQRHKEIPSWDEMPAALKPVLIRQMEVYAGFMEHTDHRSVLTSNNLQCRPCSSMSLKVLVTR
jgi:arylsulfatase A-like enzyme